MPATVPPLRRGAGVWLLRAVLVVSVTIGLFAMHTLPGMAMSSSMAAGQPMGIAAEGQPAMALTAALSASGAQPATDCMADHAMCQAVLQTSSFSTAQAETPATVPPAPLGNSSLAHVLLVGPRAPPGVCLVRLCISRT
jgi:hypothetical protein